MILVSFLLILIRVCVTCRFSYLIVSYLSVSFRASITLVGEERAIFSANVYVVSVRTLFTLTIYVWERLRNFIDLPYKYYGLLESVIM